MRNVQILGPDRFAYLNARKSDGDLANVIWIKVGNGFRSYESIDPKNGKIYIKEGKFVPEGKSTDIFQKCPARVWTIRR
jgi:hypothetical protein